MTGNTDEFSNDVPLAQHLAQLPEYIRVQLKTKRHPDLLLIADRTGVSYGNLRKFMDGQTRNPTLKTLVALCEEFNIDVKSIPTVAEQHESV